MALDFTHRFEAATDPNRQPLLLLHGTGGDENDLLPLGQSLAPGAALLAPRGKVLERGMPRFFARLAEGVFDPDEVRRRARELADFVTEACRTYGLSAPIAVGFSNGANVAAVMLTLEPSLFAGAVLLRPMAVLQDRAADLRSLPVLMLSGSADPIVPPASAEVLETLLRAGGANVTHRRVPAGHGLIEQDMDLARDWLAKVVD